MIRRPELLALSADLQAHLVRVEREVADIEGLVGPDAPDRTVLWAVAGHLQAFYTGCQAILQRVIERFEGLPRGRSRTRHSRVAGGGERGGR